MADDEMVTVRRDDLNTLVVACLKYVPGDLGPDAWAAFGRLGDARHQGADPIPEADPRPAGFWGRAEIPGMRNHTGWITEETRFGTQLAVVRDWNGAVIAEMGIGPACRVLHLPTPLKRPGPVAAITAGDDEDDLDDGYDRDFDGPVL